MGNFIMAGGWSMIVVILFGGITLVSAILFAARADARKLALVRAMTWATLFASLGGMLSNFRTVMTKAPNIPEWATSAELRTVILMEGLGEAVTTGIMAFSLISLAWLVVAVGTRRLQDRDL